MHVLLMERKGVERRIATK